MSLVHESEVIEAMLHEEDRQHFNKVMTGLDTDTFHEILGEYRKQEGDAAAEREKIINRLSIPHEPVFNYPFVWEHWKLKK